MSPQNSLNPVKCPSCNRPISVPASAASRAAANPPEQPTTRPPVEHRSQVRLSLAIGLLGITSSIGAIWYSYSQHQHFQDKTREIAAATAQLAAASSAATEWIAKPSDEQLDDDFACKIETQLITALANPYATNRPPAEEQLKELRKTREEGRKLKQLQDVEQQVAKQLAGQTVALLEDAKALLQQKDIPAAIVKLKKYLADPEAPNLKDAQQLLIQAERSLSDERAIIDKERHDLAAVTESNNAAPAMKAEESIPEANNKGEPIALVPLMELYARVQIDITNHSNLLLLAAQSLEEVKQKTFDADACNEFVKQAAEQYGQHDSQLLQQDLEILNNLIVDPEMENTHATFIKYVQSAMEVERAAPLFFTSFSFEDASVLDSKGRKSLRPPIQNIDADQLAPFKAAQSNAAVAANAWNEQWKEVVKSHGVDLKRPKSWAAFVMRVSKATIKKKN